MDARMELDSFMGSSAVASFSVLTVTVPFLSGETFAPRSEAMASMERTSPMSGTFENVTGDGHRSDATMSGRASFLLPVTVMVP